MTTPDAELHEVSAYYDNLTRTRAELPAPVLECSCGFRCMGDDWEEAGGEFDTHMGEVRLRAAQA